MRSSPPRTSAVIALNGCRIAPALDGAVEVVEAAPQNRAFPDRVSESLGVCLKVGPEHELKADGKNLRYPADAVCVRTPGCIWSTRATGDVGFLSIDIETRLLPPGGLRGTMAFLPPRALPSVPRAIQVLASDAATLHKETAVAALIQALLAAGIVSSSDLGPRLPRRAVALARELLVSRLEDPPTLQELADAVGGNRFALLRQFQRETGLPPHAFLIRMRVERARWLLARGGDLTEVALSVGFADQSHLSRAFKRVIGVSPGVYRRTIRTVA